MFFKYNRELFEFWNSLVVLSWGTRRRFAGPPSPSPGECGGGEYPAAEGEKAVCRRLAGIGGKRRRRFAGSPSPSPGECGGGEDPAAEGERAVCRRLAGIGGKGRRWGIAGRWSRGAECVGRVVCVAPGGVSGTRCGGTECFAGRRKPNPPSPVPPQVNGSLEGGEG
jgi:hypothetical protein